MRDSTSEIALFVDLAERLCYSATATSGALGPHCPFNHYLRNERSQQKFETFNVTRSHPSFFSEVRGEEARARSKDCTSEGQESSSEAGGSTKNAETEGFSPEG